MESALERNDDLQKRITALVISSLLAGGEDDISVIAVELQEGQN